MTLRLPDSGAEVSPDGRRHAPSAARNAEPILAALQASLPPRGRLLELASGTGQHAAAFAAALPGWHWQPSDVEPGNFRSIAAWAAPSAGRIAPPIRLDAGRGGWAVGLPGFDAVLVVNLLHLIPDAAALAVVEGMAAVLCPGGVALVYGPFLRDGLPTSPGDADFDAALRAQDPTIGYKDVAWVDAALARAGCRVTRHDMPANNLMLIAFKG
jgi:SAM-dependent methyltransferase